MHAALALTLAVALGEGPASPSVPTAQASESAGPASPSVLAEQASESAWTAARAAEDAGDFPRALERDRTCIALSPTSRWAERASDRIAWIEARSEGNFEPLIRLEHVRRDPELANDPAQVLQLAHAADVFPPGRVRVEARMLVAEAWLGRLHRPSDALPLLRAVAGDPHADALTARLAERELVDASLASGALDEAAREADLHRDALDSTFVAHVARLLRRRTVMRLSVAVLAVFALSATAAFIQAKGDVVGRTLRLLRAFLPTALSFAAYVAIVGGGLAAGYESGNAAPFLLFGAATVPLLFVARVWSAVGAPTPRARFLRALLAATSLLAAAFLVLDALDPVYLDGFGL